MSRNNSLGEKSKSSILGYEGEVAAQAAEDCATVPGMLIAIMIKLVHKIKLKYKAMTNLALTIIAR